MKRDVKFRLLGVTSVSACFELVNTAPYYAPAPYDVTLNGAPALQGVRTNVFSLFDLAPATDYQVEALGQTMTIRTRPETACMDITDFGAIGDGKSDNTDTIQMAIYACPVGGRVSVPAGVYFTRALVLKSGITLELKEGATLLADPVEEHYPILPGEVPAAPAGEGVGALAGKTSDTLAGEGGGLAGKASGAPAGEASGDARETGRGEVLQISSWEGAPCPSRQSILSAFYARDITIVGRGVIDGNAQNSTWWNDVKARKIGRPKLVFLNHCENVLFHGVLGKNSPSWHFHPFFCKNVDFFDVAVEAPKDSPNTDGTDPESCDGVRYIGVRFSVGDDAIAIKSGKMYMGARYKTPAIRHTVRNCLMEYAHGAMVLGSEMSGGIKELSVSQCWFSHTDRGMRIKTRRGRGKYGVIDGVEFSNIYMDNVMCPFVINMYYFCDPDGHEEIVWSKEPHPVDDTTPYLGRFTFRDITCADCEWAAGWFYGLTEQPVGSVTLENVTFTLKPDASSGRPAMMDHIGEVSKRGLYFNCVRKVRLKNVTISGQEGDEVTALNVDEVVRE